MDYSARCAIRVTLLTDHRLIQRKTSYQPVSSSTSQANFCPLLATQPLQTNIVQLYGMAGVSISHLVQSPQHKSHSCVLRLSLAPTQRHISAGCNDLTLCDQLEGTFCLPLAICNHFRPSPLVGQWEGHVPEPRCQGERTSFHWSLADPRLHPCCYFLRH